MPDTSFRMWPLTGQDRIGLTMLHDIAVITPVSRKLYANMLRNILLTDTFSFIRTIGALLNIRT